MDPSKALVHVLSCRRLCKSMGLGITIQGCGHWVSGLGFWVLGFGSRVFGALRLWALL